MPQIAPPLTRTRIGPRSAGLTMTAEEFDAIEPDRCDLRYRYELIRGVLVVSPMAGIAERLPNDVLGHLLRIYQETHPQGGSLDETAFEETVAVGEGRRRCDRAIWAGLGRTPDFGRDTPTILVEFVSPSRQAARRDYEQKRDEYLAAGIREYWVIDRFDRSMTIFRPGPDGPLMTTIRENQGHQTPILPGFVLPIARLLTETDKAPRRKTKLKPKPPGRRKESE